MKQTIVNTILPTTMVGSYPRPHWFTEQLLGRDVRVAFKEVQHEEAYDDAVATVIRDQHPSTVGAIERTTGAEIMDDWGGVINSGPVTRGPIRLADLYKVAARHAKVPVKVSVGAGPANLGMAGVEFLKNLPKDKDVQIGVLDIRTNASTDCGMKPLARMVAKMKLRALAQGAAIVRNELR
jgi:hypothetical protein